MLAFVGAYELAEASRYLYATSPGKLPAYPCVRRWVRSGLPVADARSTPGKQLLLTFEDLISLRMVIALRVAGFSLQHIRKVHGWLQEATRYSRPFALKELWVSETEVFVRMEGWLSATRRGQYAMEFIKDWLRRLRRPLDSALDLSFAKVNGQEVASTWISHPYVVLDPLVQFGAPCIQGTRIPTGAVWSMFLGGDKPEAVAKDYGVPVFKVHAALEWEKRLAGLVL